jgi:hypothetical protein
MMQEMTDEDLVRSARRSFPMTEPLPASLEIPSVMINALADALERQIRAGKPIPMSWEGVWGQFDAQKRASTGS